MKRRFCTDFIVNSDFFKKVFVFSVLEDTFDQYSVSYGLILVRGQSVFELKSPNFKIKSYNLASVRRFLRIGTRQHSLTNFVVYILMSATFR